MKFRYVIFIVVQFRVSLSRKRGNVLLSLGRELPEQATRWSRLGYLVNWAKIQ